MKAFILYLVFITAGGEADTVQVPGYYDSLSHCEQALESASDNKQGKITIRGTCVPVNKKR
ncbi:hypothetical protein [Vibrio phage BX-1]|nr:hypothetical protein [Vibrio phage BX-1]